MHISVGKDWEDFVAAAVKDGRFDTADDVVREALRLLEVRESKLKDLRQTVQNAIARGGECSEDDIDAAVKTRLDAWEQRQKAAS